MSNFKAIIDINVLPKDWIFEDLVKVAEESGFIVVDTTNYKGDDFGVRIIDDDLEIKTIEEYESNKI